MEDLQLFNFKVESNVHNYEVRFEDFYDSIREIANEGDIVIGDGNVIGRINQNI